MKTKPKTDQQLICVTQGFLICIYMIKIFSPASTKDLHATFIYPVLVKSRFSIYFSIL